MGDAVIDRSEFCDLCGERLGAMFVDGKTVLGPWAVMCAECWCAFGVGLGPGRGQLRVSGVAFRSGAGGGFDEVFSV